MKSICNYLMNGCLSRKTLSNSFLKKPLVAISLLVIITMCLTTAEGGPVHTAHKRRHHHSRDQHRMRLVAMALRTKEEVTKRPESIALEKVITMLKSTSTNYNKLLDTYKKRVDHIVGVSSTGNAWLPKINFVSLHNHEYMKLSKRIKYFIPKLYRHLKQYELRFNLLANITNNSKVLGSDHHREKRQDFINDTLGYLQTLLIEVEDAMDLVHLKIRKLPEEALPPLEKDDHLFQIFQCQLVGHGFRNLLMNWKAELQCSKAKRLPGRKLSRMCLEYEKRLENRRSKKQRRDTQHNTS